MTRRKTSHNHRTCQVLRRRLALVVHQTRNAANDVHNTLGTEWVTEPCGTLLFTPEHRKTGECAACAEGWTHPHNYRV